uniref:Uncharacterized protein n=1 Tax=Picea glauca TaxID=3330 RepID=A0A101M271_PICGL|nr:hypothetical protein ABT39_MTgene2855 [Picea glauca]
MNQRALRAPLAYLPVRGRIDIILPSICCHPINVFQRVLPEGIIGGLYIPWALVRIERVHLRVPSASKVIVSLLKLITMLL